MARLLAKLGPVFGDRRREILARGKATVEEVGDQVLLLPDGAVVLLDGTGPPWLRAEAVDAKPWPRDLGALEDLVANKREPMGIDVRGWFSGRGEWLLDSRGQPVELGQAKGGITTILNYAGWRLGDFPGREIEVVPTKAPRGPVLIVPPESVLEPRVEGPPVAAPESHSPSPAGIQVIRQLPSTSQQAKPKRFDAQARPPIRTAEPHATIGFDVHLRFTDLQFVDGAVSFSVPGRRVTVLCDKALALYQDVRAELDAEQPTGITAKGELLPDGTSRAIITGLETLDRLFARVQRGQFIRRSIESQGWLDAEDLAQRFPSGPGRPDPADLIDIEEFGLGKRAEAFRRLFAHRDKSVRVAMLPGRAVIIPIAARDGGPRFHVWETVTDDFATYIFRRGDRKTLLQMLDWTRDPEHRRRELLANKDLQRELGFVTRVIHDGYEHDLAPWWNRICEVTGINPAEADARSQPGSLTIPACGTLDRDCDASAPPT